MFISCMWLDENQRQHQRLEARIQYISGLVVANEFFILDIRISLIQFILSFAYNCKVEREYSIAVR